MINQGHYKTHVGVGRRRFSLYEIYQDVISEIFDFDQIKKYPLRSNSEGWEFNAKINGELVIVYIYLEKTRFDRFSFSPKHQSEIDYNGEIFNFGFEISEGRKSGQYAKTTFKDYIKILATVGDALNQFIRKKKPEIITFFSESKHGGLIADTQKDDIYFKALDNNKPADYEIENTNDTNDGKHGIMLFRKH